VTCQASFTVSGFSTVCGDHSLSVYRGMYF